MSIWRAEATEAGERLQRVAAPMSDVKNHVAGAIDQVQGRLVDARDSASSAVAESPFRWVLIALAAGIVIGAAFAYRRTRWQGGHWTE